MDMLTTALFVAAQGLQPVPMPPPPAPPPPARLTTGSFECTLADRNDNRLSFSGRLGKAKSPRDEFYPAARIESTGEPEISGVYSAMWMGRSLQLVDAPAKKRYLVSILLHDLQLLDGEAGVAMYHTADTMYGGRTRYGGTCRTHFDYGPEEQFQ